MPTSEKALGEHAMPIMGGGVKNGMTPALTLTAAIWPSLTHS